MSTRREINKTIKTLVIRNKKLPEDHQLDIYILFIRKVLVLRTYIYMYFEGKRHKTVLNRIFWQLIIQQFRHQPPELPCQQSPILMISASTSTQPTITYLYDISLNINPANNHLSSWYQPQHQPNQQSPIFMISASAWAQPTITYVSSWYQSQHKPHQPASQLPNICFILLRTLYKSTITSLKRQFNETFELYFFHNSNLHNWARPTG